MDDNNYNNAYEITQKNIHKYKSMCQSQKQCPQRLFSRQILWIIRKIIERQISTRKSNFKMGKMFGLGINKSDERVTPILGEECTWTFNALHS